MSPIKTAAILVAAASLSACVIIDADTKQSSWSDAPDRRLGLLYGAEVGVRAPEVSIIVQSNGCTERAHFQTRAERRGRDSYAVSFRRVVEDHCRALMPEGARLTWTYQELGLPPGVQVIVANPIGR